jgi:hypothetical protein
MLRTGVWSMTLVAALGLSAGARPRHAHQADRANAQTAQVIGEQLFKTGDYSGALEAFERSYLLVDDAAVLLKVARCRHALGEAAETGRLAQRVLRKTPPGSPLAERAERLLAELDREAAQARVVEPPPWLDPVAASAGRVIGLALIGIGVASLSPCVPELLPVALAGASLVRDGASYAGRARASF